jgi:uncharacterized membrane protein
MPHRSTHYWLWFLFFGVIAGAITYTQHHMLDSESIWLLVSGLLGLVVGAKWLSDGQLARPYDVVVGLIFAVAGAVGILHGFGANVLPKSALNSAITSTSLLGLSLALFPSLIHAVLGLQSIRHGARSK